ncbi:MAG: urease accessory protein UreE [Hyphomicrobiales bacterium]|nr:urease accessory protein UreE [Hyphomicrobiales bacterium]
MLIATRLLQAHDAAAPLDTVTLDHDTRSKRRFRVTSDNGRDVLIDLAEAAQLAHGARLEVDGGFIEMRAALEELLEIRGADPLALARIAWHLGNRHTAAEITADAIYIQPDHVLGDMARRLGAATTDVMRLFNPEGGAYGGHGTQGHNHHKKHGHAEHAPHNHPDGE